MPFPSAACHTCKLRRIKVSISQRPTARGARADPPGQCDETKPVCQRCIKAQRVCIDADTARQAAFSIHVENGYASGKVKRPRGPRSSLTGLRPQVDLQTQALVYYLSHHIKVPQDAPNVACGLPGCVSAWKLSGIKCSMVDLALSCISLAVFSHTQRQPIAATEASSSYERLLRVAQKRIVQVGLPTLNERDIDACLLAIFFMGRYEGVTNGPRRPNAEDLNALRSWSHHDGAMAILKVWHSAPAPKSPSTIVKQTRRGLIKSALLRNLPLPVWIQDGEDFGEQDFDLDYDRVIVRTVNLHYRLSDLKAANANQLNDETQELETALQNWADNIPCSYERYIVAESDPWPRKHFYSPTVFHYSRPAWAAVWSQFFATRILIHSMRLRILFQSWPIPLGGSPNDAQMQDCVVLLKEMSDSLASTVPFCLERFTVDTPTTPNRPISVTPKQSNDIKPYLASQVVWPLTIASSCQGIDVKQQQWFKSELAGMGRITGDGILEYAETDSWTVF